MNDVMHRYLTEATQRQLLATIKRDAAAIARRDFAWMRLLLNSGMRIGEFSLLTVKQARFALSTRWIFIPASDRKGGKVDHKIPVTAPMLEDFRALLAIHTEMGGDDDDASPLILSRKHGRMSIRQYQLRVEYWCQRAGIERASPHWFRHTRAMNVMRRSESRDPRGVVKGLLGHASIASTGVYTRVTKEELLEAVEKVDGRPRLRREAVRKMFEGVGA